MMGFPMMPMQMQQMTQPQMSQPQITQLKKFPQHGQQGTPGYRMFVKSLTDEILKRNANANQAEMRKIVDNEWLKLPDVQKQVYEKLGMTQPSEF